MIHVVNLIKSVVRHKAYAVNLVCKGKRQLAGNLQI